ncbi:MAG: class I SAM-dependent RNA methyltransferase [Rhodobacteraceae bacterium]|nr:class I SAM-dependent RNA methyltransferase [Paracoccaceae bacterium]
MSLKIERLGHQGDGIAADGTLVARALPGEVVEGEIANGRIDAPRILTPSDQRVSAPCRHYKSCGGCALQHAAPGFVEGWKADVVRRALDARGLPAPVRAVHTSPAQSRRRAVFAGRRLKTGALVGFHGRRSQTLVAVPDCQILDPAILACLPALEAIASQIGSRKGELQLTVTSSANGPDVLVSGAKSPSVEDRMALSDLARDHGLARLTVGDDLVAGRAAPAQSFGGAEVTPPPGAFLQATPQGEAALTRAALTAIGDTGPVADLFAGCGTFTFPAARRVPVHAVEGSAGMIAALDHGMRHSTGFKPITHEVRDLFRRPLLAGELKRFAAVIIDPPRAGAEAQMRALAEAGVPRIASLSCNPVSFARDTEILVAAGYALDWIEVVDQFRWSPHVEIAAQLTRA